MATRAQEPVEDTIGLIRFFDRSKQHLKSAGLDTDIFKYDDANHLRRTLEDLGQSKSQKSRELRRDEVDTLGKFGDWLLTIPHTQEASCQLGKGTTWCTSSTQTGNMFLSYVAKKNKNIILYYLLRQGADSKIDPTAKLSVATVKGRIDASGKNGGLSVDARNKGLTLERLRSILGDQFEQIVKAIKDHSASLMGAHPAKLTLRAMASGTDIPKLEKHLSNLGNEALQDFLVQLSLYKTTEPVSKIIVDKSELGTLLTIASNPVSSDMLARLSTNEHQRVRQAVALNKMTNKKILDSLAGDLDVTVQYNVAKHRKTSPETLRLLSKNSRAMVRAQVAGNRKTPIDVLQDLSRDPDNGVQSYLKRNLDRF